MDVVNVDVHGDVFQEDTEEAKAPSSAWQGPLGARDIIAPGWHNECGGDLRPHVADWHRVSSNSCL